MNPLEGIRVVEVSRCAFVASAGAVLADWGAEVVKVEAPGGDPTRGVGIEGIDPGNNGVGFLWEVFNRGKKSAVLDLNTSEGHQILMRLVEDADVFLTSLLPDSRALLRIDVGDVHSVNPTAVYAVGSSHGALGDEAGLEGSDAMTYWARGGIAAALTPDRCHPLAMPSTAFGDCTSGALFAGGISAALVHRDRTGAGSVVDASLLAAAMWSMQAGIVGSSVLNVESLPMTDRRSGGNPLANTYRTSDGRYIALNMPDGDERWDQFCEAIGREDLVHHPLFGTAALRVLHIDECLEELDTTFASLTLKEWRRSLATQPGQWDVLQSLGELRRDPQALANGYIQTVEYGNGRTLEMVASPVQFDREAPHLRPAPELGQDTDQLLFDVGMSRAEVTAARAKGTVG